MSSHRKRKVKNKPSQPSQKRRKVADKDQNDEKEGWQWNNVFKNSKTQKSLQKPPTYTVSEGMVIAFANVFKYGIRVQGKLKYMQQRSITSWLQVIDDNLEYPIVHKIINNSERICNANSIKTWNRWHEIEENKCFWSEWTKLLKDLQSTLSIWINEKKFKCLKDENQLVRKIKTNIKYVSLNENIQLELVLWATKPEISES
eukprot:469848_1